MEVFQDYAYYYNTFYQNKDYKAEAEQVSFLLNKYGKNINKLLNFGCGTGNHDIELTKLGYLCQGIDMSSEMIELAKRNAEKEAVQIKFSVEDIRQYISMERYDAVISLFHVMSYQNKNDDILAAFRSARKALDADGIFIFDVWYGPGVLSEKPCVRVKEIEDQRNKLIRIAKPVMYDKKNVVDVNYEILVFEKENKLVNVFNETHSMRYFFRPELKFFLNETGFELIDNLDCKTLGPTDYNSWTSYFIARAV